MNVDEYRRIKETLDVLGKPGLLRQVAKSRAFYLAGGRGLSFEDVFAEPLAPAARKRPKRKPA